MLNAEQHVRNDIEETILN